MYTSISPFSGGIVSKKLNSCSGAARESFARMLGGGRGIRPVACSDRAEKLVSGSSIRPSETNHKWAISPPTRIRSEETFRKPETSDSRSGEILLNPHEKALWKSSNRVLRLCSGRAPRREGGHWNLKNTQPLMLINSPISSGSP